MRIRGVLFDVDGTLYHQRPLRLLMGAELATTPWVRHAPWNVPRLWRMLSVFRRVREDLRLLGRSAQPLARLQYMRTAEQARVPVGDVEAAVREWIYERPLKYLPRVVRPGMREVLAGLTARGLQVGVFSDYPVSDKLEAMGLRATVSLALDATDEAINAFKPHPRGLELACQQWGLAPDEVLYVGDRVDVDARSAAAAGMPCAIVGQTRGEHAAAWPHTPLEDMRELLTHLDRFEGAR